ncbi:MAG: hypothetical protein ABJN95_11720 [Maribacter sp.]|uniref:hypothetical protein n=1 Tax=Maribacter sp. TaxID=1897614 RepID=UPI0032994F62
MNSRKAITIILGILLVTVLFHLCIIVQLIPYDITWGGRLKTDAEMYVFESLSLLLNIVLGWILLIKGRYTRAVVSIKLVNTILWGFLFLFVLNTIGNLLAETNFEKLFALLTLALAILLWIVLRKKT